jgi:CheY-like chemotaxis protein
LPFSPRAAKGCATRPEEDRNSRKTRMAHELQNGAPKTSHAVPNPISKLTMVWFSYLPFDHVPRGSRRGAMTYCGSTVNCVARVLLAAEDPELRTFLYRVLDRAGYDVAPQLDDSASLWTYCQWEHSASDLEQHDLLICDVRILNDELVAVLERLQARQRCPPIILLKPFGRQAADEHPYSRLEVTTVLYREFDAGGYLAKVRQSLTRS